MLQGWDSSLFVIRVFYSRDSQTHHWERCRLGRQGVSLVHNDVNIPLLYTIVSFYYVNLLKHNITMYTDGVQLSVMQKLFLFTTKHLTAERFYHVQTLIAQACVSSKVGIWRCFRLLDFKRLLQHLVTKVHNPDDKVLVITPSRWRRKIIIIWF